MKVILQVVYCQIVQIVGFKIRIMEEKFKKYIQDHVMHGLKKMYPKYKIEIGRGDRVMVDDKIIKGILFTPSRTNFNNVEMHIKGILEEIGVDVKRGRFIGLTKD